MSDIRITEIYANAISEEFNPYQDKNVVLVAKLDFDLNDFKNKTLDESISILQEYKDSFDQQTTISVWKTEENGYYCTPTAELYIYRAETDEEFNRRQKRYKKEG